MKKNLFVGMSTSLVVLFSANAFASVNNVSTYCKPGFYAGIETGYSNTHYTPPEVLSEAQTHLAGKVVEEQLADPFDVASGRFMTGNVNTAGMGGRIFAGYQFNRYFALETGYLQLNKTDFSGGGDYALIDDDDVAFSFGHLAYDGELTEHAIDLVGKITYPLPEGFGVFVKAGAAYVGADRHINLHEDDYTGYDNPVHTFLDKTLYTKSYQAVRPTYGVGIDYTIPNTSFDVSVTYSEILGGGGIEKISFAGLGLSVKFA